MDVIVVAVRISKRESFELRVPLSACRVRITTFLRQTFEVTRVLVTRIYSIRCSESELYVYILRLFPLCCCVNDRLSLSLEDVSIYRGEALIEFRCYFRVEFRGGGIYGLLNSSIDQGRNHVHYMLSSRKTSTSEHTKSL